MKQIREFPRVVVTRKGAQKVKSGHPWVFEGEVTAVQPAPSDGREAENGDVVDVVDEGGTYLGSGLLSERSKIRVRLVSRNANDRFDEAFWARKVEWAWRYRANVMGSSALPGCEPDTNCCRVIYSEADGFPGLIVDRYEDVLVAQVGTVGMQRLRPVLYPIIVRTLRDQGQAIRGIYERNDVASRSKEGLDLAKGWYLDDESIAPGADERQTRLVARENGIAYDVDFAESQKTGFFLDQKFNRRLVRDIARGRRVLDCYSHVGTFGLNAVAGGANFVRCVDVSQPALDLAQANARLNGFEDRMSFTCADMKDYLPELVSDRKRLIEQGGQFDLIVLDPPAFSKGRESVEHAQGAYERINYLAMRILPRGGYLATCSCSQHMTTGMLRKAIAQAAEGAGVQLRQISQSQQSPDHPILWGVPETGYLDFFVFQVF
jgi:23S rRNA (cytosine1962-C5)-methyltransferase